MQYLRIALLVLFTIGLATTGYGQKADRMEKKAMEKTEEINKEIIAADEDLALSAEQMEQTTAVLKTMFKEIKAAKKSGGDKAAIKAIRKEHMKVVYGDILTKDQRKARKSAKQ